MAQTLTARAAGVNRGGERANDNIDTAREDAKLNTFFAAFRHEQSITDTSKRIRRTHRSRFMEGWIVQNLTYGYIKPRPKCHDSEVTKDPAAEPIILEGYRILDEGGTFAEVADMFNARGAKPGPAAQRPRFTPDMVANTLRNPIMKGVRQRNKKMSVRKNITGRHRSKPAPKEDLLERFCPHLAFVTAEYFDRVIAKVDADRDRYRRGRNGKPDPRKDVPRKRTRFPGQHMRCGICDARFYWTGSKGVGLMVCSAASAHGCWNSVNINGAKAAENLIKAAIAAIEKLPAFDETVLAEAKAAWAAANQERTSERTQLTARTRTVQADIDAIVDAPALLKSSVSLGNKLVALEEELQQLQVRLAEIESAPTAEPRMPTTDEIKEAMKVVETSAINTEEGGCSNG